MFSYERLFFTIVLLGTVLSSQPMNKDVHSNLKERLLKAKEKQQQKPKDDTHLLEIQFEQPKNNEIVSTHKQCAYCHEDTNEPFQQNFSYECSHQFHQSCVNTLIAANERDGIIPLCPLCRKPKKGLPAIERFKLYINNDHHDEDAMEMILKREVDAHTKDQDNNTVLHLILGSQLEEKTIQESIEAILAPCINTNDAINVVNAKNQDGETPLHVAALNNNIGAINTVDTF